MEVNSMFFSVTRIVQTPILQWDESRCLDYTGCTYLPTYNISSHVLQDFSRFCRTSPKLPQKSWPYTSNSRLHTKLYHQNARYKFVGHLISKICRTAGYLRQKCRTILQKAGRLATMGMVSTSITMKMLAINYVLIKLSPPPPPPPAP